MLGASGPYRAARLARCHPYRLFLRKRKVLLLTKYQNSYKPLISWHFIFISLIIILILAVIYLNLWAEFLHSRCEVLLIVLSDWAGGSAHDDLSATAEALPQIANP
jgi:hypothetical protein